MKLRTLPSLICFALLAGCGKSPAAWVPVTSTDGGFTVSFPAKPVEQIKDINGIPQMPQAHALSAKKDGRLYSVYWADFPADLMKLMTDEQIYASIIKSYNTADKKVLNDKTITINGHTGHELELQLSDGRTHRARFFLAGGRFYQQATYSPAASRNDPDSDKFMDSFTLTSK